jgi:hypothetical protein
MVRTPENTKEMEMHRRARGDEGVNVEGDDDMRRRRRVEDPARPPEGQRMVPARYEWGEMELKRELMDVWNPDPNLDGRREAGTADGVRHQAGLDVHADARPAKTGTPHNGRASKREI